MDFFELLSEVAEPYAEYIGYKYDSVLRLSRHLRVKCEFVRIETLQSRYHILDSSGQGKLTNAHWAEQCQ